MHNLSSNRFTVSFTGVDWKFEEIKSEKRFAKKRDKKRYFANTAKMPTSDQLRRFLEAASSSQDPEKAKKLREMETAEDLFLSNAFKGFSVRIGVDAAASSDDLAKVNFIAENLEAAEKDKKVKRLLVGWREDAIDDSMYHDSSTTSPSRSTDNSQLSDLTDDSGLNPREGDPMEAAKELYSKTIRLVWFQGLALKMDKKQISNATDQIFHRQEQYTQTVVSASETSFHDALECLDAWKGPSKNDADSNSKGELYSIDSGTSENGQKLHAFALTVVHCEMEHRNKSEIDSFISYCFKKDGHFGK